MLDIGGIMKDVHEMLIIALAPARVQLVRVSRFTPFLEKKKISRTSRQTSTTRYRPLCISRLTNLSSR